MDGVFDMIHRLQRLFRSEKQETDDDLVERVSLPIFLVQIFMFPAILARFLLKILQKKAISRYFFPEKYGLLRRERAREADDRGSPQASRCDGEIVRIRL